MLIGKTLAAVLEDADARHSAAYAPHYQELRAIPTEVFRIAGATAVYAGPNMPMNRTIGLGMGAMAVTPSQLAAIEIFYQQHRARCQVDWCPYAHASVLELLRKNRYVPFKQYNVWFMTLQDMPTAATDTDVQVAVATDQATWVVAVGQGFAEVDDVSATEDEGPPFNQIAFRRRDTTCFLATIADEAVGGGVLSMAHPDVGLLFSASTRPAFRGRGVHMALMRARLEMLHTAGYKLAMIMSAPGATSERNIQRAGFRLAYTKTVFSAVGRVPRPRQQPARRPSIHGVLR